MSPTTADPVLNAIVSHTDQFVAADLHGQLGG
jgi:hypothetical protein